ncbi:hypothetical protein FB451DRAFT_1172247 [Mycena latifolia]|nr:hypothetical protein FB451DRAFT_1172247 [Mycena latifolia]
MSENGAQILSRTISASEAEETHLYMPNVLELPNAWVQMLKMLLQHRGKAGIPPTFRTGNLTVRQRASEILNETTKSRTFLTGTSLSLGADHMDNTEFLNVVICDGLTANSGLINAPQRQNMDRWVTQDRSSPERERINVDTQGKTPRHHSSVDHFLYGEHHYLLMGDASDKNMLHFHPIKCYHTSGAQLTPDSPSSEEPYSSIALGDQVAKRRGLQGQKEHAPTLSSKWASVCKIPGWVAGLTERANTLLSESRNTQLVLPSGRSNSGLIVDHPLKFDVWKVIREVREAT